jgi:hypothetical protein
MKLFRRLAATFVAALVLASLGTLVQSSTTHALSGSGFQAGRIIDDNVFSDGNAMDIPTIQAFLNSKVPTCDTNGTQASGHSGYSTRAQWGAANGAAAPYTCLKDYMADSYGMAADQYCSAIGYGRFSAAGMIYSAGKACGISQKVLIVLLQKEQGLVTDDWPWPVEYTAATGYGCPDTASCDPSYSGLFNQIYYAARQYKKYAAQPTLFNFQRNVSRNIAWSPNGACGTGSVFLQNQATAGLYNYTPYQPNSAALNNLDGAGDGCSAYGNRNFWRQYNDWFGNTYGVPFSGTYVGQSTGTVWVNQTTSPVVWLDYQNTGAQFWKDKTSAPSYYPVTRLMGSNPINRASIYADPSWPLSNRPAEVFAKVFESDGVTLAADQHTVFPGQVARFQFTLHYPGPSAPVGSFRENFSLVEDGAPNWWVPGTDASFIVNTTDPFRASFRGESAPSGVSLSTGQKKPVSFDFQNTGAEFWKDDLSALPYYPRLRLVGTWPINRQSSFYDSSSWLSSSRPVSVFTQVFESDGVTLAADQHTVFPGQVARFQFLMAYPTTGISSGTHQENFELVQDGTPNWWVPGSYAWQAVTTTP